MLRSLSDPIITNYYSLVVLSGPGRLLLTFVPPQAGAEPVTERLRRSERRNYYEPAGLPRSVDWNYQGNPDFYTQWGVPLKLDEMI